MVGLVPGNIAHSHIPSQIVICTCRILQVQTQLKQTQRMCSNSATTSHHSFLVLKRSSVPIQLWVNLSAGCPKRTLFGFQPGKCSIFWNLLHLSETFIPPHLAKHGPRQQEGSFAVSGNTCWWSTRCCGGAPPFAYGTALALGLTETSLQSVELLRKCQKKTAQWPHFSILTCKWKETLIVCLCHLLPQLTDAKYSLRWH